MINELETILEFSPVLIATFAGLSMMIVQMLKSAFPYVDTNPKLFVSGLALFFAVMVVYEVTAVLEVAIIAFLIMSAASGVYSSTKRETRIDLPDYSDNRWLHFTLK